MLDINRIRENKQGVEQALLKRLKKGSFDLDEILKTDEKRRELIQKLEILQAEKNKFSKTKPTPEIMTEMKKVGAQVKKLEEEKNKADSRLTDLLVALPNTPLDEVPAGDKENNQVVYEFGQKPEFDFKPKDHVELATTLGLIDYERAVKMSGSGFWAYTGVGAILEWALLNYFIDFHRQNNYTFIIPPYLLNEDSAFVSGHLPKFRDDLYWTQDNNCLNATSEMMMGNYHRDEILSAEELPKKYFAYSTCFRREAGSYRTEERGMVRGHQFNKIELFVLCSPEDSEKYFQELTGVVKKLIEGLGLHYQLSLLAAGDASSAMAKTMDAEVWIPSMNIYKEVSSISTAMDYQARRGNIRARNKDDKKQFVCTLNASGLATSRLIPAILEQNQQFDGSVNIPEALQKFVNLKKIKAGN